MSIRDILADVHALEEELYFGEWASVYRIWLTRQAEYRNEIELKHYQ